MRQQLSTSLGQFGKVQEAAQRLAAVIAQKGLSPEDVEQFLQMAEYVLQNPEAYPAVVRQVVESGVVSDSMFPPQFDPNFVSVLIAALHIVQQQQEQQVSPLRAMGSMG